MNTLEVPDDKTGGRGQKKVELNTANRLFQGSHISKEGLEPLL